MFGIFNTTMLIWIIIIAVIAYILYTNNIITPTSTVETQPIVLNRNENKRKINEIDNNSIGVIDNKNAKGLMCSLNNLGTYHTFYNAREMTDKYINS